MRHAKINKWIKALESGEYKQTRGKLYNNRSHGFCCLGVLTNEYCETKNMEFDDVTGYQKAYDYKFEELSDCKQLYGFTDSELKEEAKEDAESVLETTHLKTFVRRWVGLKNEINIKKLYFDNNALKAYNKSSHLNSHLRSVTDVLAALNDGGASFKTIAKFIKDNKRELFK